MVRSRCGTCIFYKNGFCILKGKRVRQNFFGCRFYSSGDIINLIKKELNREDYFLKYIRFSIIIFLLIFPIFVNTNPVDVIVGSVFGILSLFGINIRK